MKWLPVASAVLAGCLICLCGDVARAAQTRSLSRMKTTSARRDVAPDENREIRTWTSQKGSTLEARLLEAQGDQLTLVKEDGTKMKISIKMLSQQDQDYVREIASAMPGTMSVNLGRAKRKNLKDPGEDVVMEFVLVEAGEFMMGAQSFAPDAVPVHKVTFSKPFYIGKHEVTVAQWEVFAEATGYKSLAEKENDTWGVVSDGNSKHLGHAKGQNWKNPGFEQTPDHPVTHVSWVDMQEFCKWATRKAGRTVRLPTEAEWEYASRGPRANAFPWGDSDQDLSYFNQADRSFVNAGWPANNWSQFADDGHVYPAPVGSFPKDKSWCGAYDMAGNVREWVQDYYDANYYSRSPEVDPAGPDKGGEVVRRGGAWCLEFYFGCGAKREKHPPGTRGAEAGFRVVMAP